VFDNSGQSPMWSRFESSISALSGEFGVVGGGQTYFGCRVQGLTREDQEAKAKHFLPIFP
jgi:hypothetical protein